jgi:hypothetical protein
MGGSALHSPNMRSFIKVVVIGTNGCFENADIELRTAVMGATQPIAERQIWTIGSCCNGVSAHPVAASTRLALLDEVRRLGRALNAAALDVTGTGTTRRSPLSDLRWASFLIIWRAAPLSIIGCREFVDPLCLAPDAAGVPSIERKKCAAERGGAVRSSA